MNIVSTLPLSPCTNGGSERQNGRFPSKIALRLTKVCYKVSLCENCQRQNCKADIYTCRNDWWGTSPCTRKFGRSSPASCKTPIYIFARSASAV